MTVRTKITPTQYRALKLIRDYPKISAKTFAKLMWADSPGWSRVDRQGRRGRGMELAGGSYLAKLRNRGWVIGSVVKYQTFFLYFSVGEAGNSLL